MKKFFVLAAAAVTFATVAIAQENPAPKPCCQGPKEDLKTGKNSVEVSFNPFSNNFTTFKLNGGAIKYRRFWGKNALRVNFGFSYDKDSKTETTYTKTVADEYTASPAPAETYPDVVDNPYTESTTTTTKGWEVKFTVGYERHFNLNRRMALYVGAELGYDGYRSGLGTVDYSKTGYVNTDKWDYSDEDYYRASETTSSLEKCTTSRSGGYNAIVFGIFTGLDFHVYKGLYLGLELGLGLNHKMYLNTGETCYTESGSSTSITYDTKGKVLTNFATTTEITRENGVQVTTTYNQNLKANTWNKKVETSYNEEDNSHSDTSFKLDVNPALRIGWRF